MAILIKLGILIYCIRYVLNIGRPGIAAGIYASTFLLLGILFGIGQPFSLLYSLGLVIEFIFNLATGFVYFWLIDRFQDSYFAFIFIILFGFSASIAVRLYMAGFFG